MPSLQFEELPRACMKYFQGDNPTLSSLNVYKMTSSSAANRKTEREREKYTPAETANPLPRRAKEVGNSLHSKATAFGIGRP
eukprot:1407280-Amphidinium_carterae.1